MTLLITHEDFINSPLKSLSANLNAGKKLNQYIQEAQVFDLKPILGQELFYDILKEYDESPALATYYDLFHGAEYTKNGRKYTHEGLVPVLCYFTYARYKANANVEETASGSVIKNNQYSEQASEKTIARQIDQARSGAYAYMQDVIKFLNDNASDYPLWKSECVESNKRSIRITGV